MQKRFRVLDGAMLFIIAAVLLFLYEKNYTTTYASEKSIQERWVTDIDLIGDRLVALEDCVTVLWKTLEDETGLEPSVDLSVLCNLSETEAVDD